MRPQARKITVSGTGPVATAVARRLCRVPGALVVVRGAGASAAAADVGAAAALDGAPGTVCTSEGWEDVAGSTVVCACDAGGLDELGREVAQRAPDAVLIGCARPVAGTVGALLGVTRFPRARVLGAGAALQASARLRALLAERLGVSVADVSSPLPDRATVAGVDAGSLLREGELELLVERAREHAAAPGAVAAAAGCSAIAEAVLGDSGRVLPCTVLLQGENGAEGIVDAPVRVGGGGVEQVLPLGTA